MVKRSTPQSVVDDAAFPVRVSIKIPGLGLGTRLDEFYAWLRELGPDGYAWHSGYLYFQSIENAAGFLATFPDVVLDDRTMTRSRPGRV